MDLGGLLFYYVMLGSTVLLMAIRVGRSSTGMGFVTFLFWPLAVIPLMTNWGVRGSDIRLHFALTLFATGMLIYKSNQAVDHLASHLSEADIAMIRQSDPHSAAEIERRQMQALGVDTVALSFVRRASDVAEVRALMEAHGRVVPIIAKIEKPEGVENLVEILEVANGIMVARGDLGVEMGPEEVPIIQKRAIELANRAGKLVITATQMLDSMIRNPRPTRAEASDVANAVLDGSDAVMLSGETASGAYPLEAVRTMDKIIRTTEREDRYWREHSDLDLGSTTNAIARAAVTCSRSLPDTKAIITYTISGGVARLVSDYRPRVPIIALTPNPATYQTLAMYWGVTPVQFTLSSAEGRSIFQDVDRLLLSSGLLARGDRFVLTLGYPLKDHKSVNLLKIHSVGESLPLPPNS